MKITKSKKILRQKSQEVLCHEFKFYKGLLQSAITMQEGHLQGCSCIQLCKPVCAFTMRDPKTKEFSFCFNPEICWKFGTRFSYEGCLSVEKRYYVKRPIIIKAQWYDEDNNKIVKILGPKKTRIFMHEMDHLAGVTIDMKGLGI